MKILFLENKEKVIDNAVRMMVGFGLQHAQLCIAIHYNSANYENYFYKDHDLPTIFP